MDSHQLRDLPVSVTKVLGIVSMITLVAGYADKKLIQNEIANMNSQKLFPIEIRQDEVCESYDKWRRGLWQGTSAQVSLW